MKSSTPVLWTFHGETFLGVLDLTSDRLLLSSRRRTFSCPFTGVAGAQLERGPAERIRGLPAVRMVLANGDELRLASLAGAGSAQELTAQIVVNVPSPSSHLFASGT